MGIHIQVLTPGGASTIQAPSRPKPDTGQPAVTAPKPPLPKLSLNP